MVKWVTTLASAVLAGVLIWLLTSDGGLLDPSQSDVRVTALSTFAVAEVGKAPSAAVEVENSGDGTATGCRVLWSPFTGDPKDLDYPATTDFSLTAGESREQPLRTAAPYTSSGTVMMAAQLICDDDESSVVTKAVQVRP